MYQPSSLSPVKLSTSPFAQASWHLSYSASTFAMSNSRLFTHLQCRIAKLEHKYDRIGGFGQAVSNPEIGKVKTKSKIWRKYKLNRETHLWLLRCSFSSNHGPKIGVSQASKSCWGGTSSKFLLSGRGMRHRPFKSSYGIPNDIKRTSKCVGVLNILVHLGLVELLIL